MTGIVFDITEFAVHDGPGLRTTVFLKGCPLRCAWCHNPEGLTAEPQILRSAAGERLAGRIYEAGELAALLARQADLLRGSGGGVTFSGGEPLAQAAFVSEVIDRLGDTHVVLDTSGQAEAEAFERLASRCGLVYFDVKLIDAEHHRQWTGVDNAAILANLARLPALGVPFVIRVPLVPTVTDMPANLAAIAQLAAGLPGLLRVDLLPYNRAAGGKYPACGLEFAPHYPEEQPVNANTSAFEALGVPVRVT
ncbi:MAG: radical SAM protein [Armatimonadetes bacterium]|nr:radical SAM protein [Armatimonadota bacterium]